MKLGDVVKNITKSHGEGTASIGVVQHDTTRIPTGTFPFDLASGGGFPEGKISVVYGPESSGKCHAAGDKVRLYRGGTKLVENVIVGDVLMGPDSTPRKVVGVGGGVGGLYKISPVKGQGEFTVNLEHQLSLVCTHTQGQRTKGDIVTISLKDYMAKSKDWKIYHHLYRVGVEYGTKEQPVDPYFLGLWLGDGSSSGMQVYSVSTEIVDWLQEYADQIGGDLTVYDKNSPCPGYAVVRAGLRDYMNDMGLFGNKHIPYGYLHGDRNQRLRLLAGLLDTDGALGKSSFVFYNSSTRLATQVKELAQSLGYYAALQPKSTACNGKIYYSWVVYISADDNSEVPLLLEYKRPDQRRKSGSTLTSRFSVDYVGEGNYYGFEVDGDHLYLTEEFIVNHNTNLCLKAIGEAQRLYPEKKCVFLDVEKSFDSKWAATMGVDVDALIYLLPNFAEEAIDMFSAVLQADDVGVIVVDSLAALTPMKEAEASAERQQVGGASLLIGNMMRRAIVGMTQAQKEDSYPTVLLINQVRIKIGVMFGNPESMPGGNALKHASGLTVRVYGKNVVDKKISDSLPAVKETKVVINKWKVPIVSINCEYNMVMIPHNGMQPGQSNDWNTIATHLRDMGILVQTPKKNWVLDGEEYKTLKECRAALESDPVKLYDTKQMIIEQKLLDVHGDSGDEDHGKEESVSDDM